MNRTGTLPTEQIGLALVAISVALLGGFLVANGSVDIMLLALTSLAGIIGLMRPAISLYALVVAALVAVGVVRLYFPQLQNIQWGVAGGTAMLGAIAALGFLFAPKKKLVLPPISSVVLLLIFLLCASAIINSQSPSLFVFGFKGYVQVIGLFFALAMLGLPGKTIDSFPKLLVAIGLVQLPFVLHQYLYIVPGRMFLRGGVVAEDVVSGTLGASATGGGSNAVLSILLVTVIGIVAAGFRRGQISAFRAGLISVVCAAPLFLNANRIAALYLVIVFAVVFAPTMFKSTSRFFGAAIITVFLVTGSIWANLNYGSRSDEFTGWQEMMQTTIERNTGEEYGYGTLELNRVTSITFWWKEQFNSGSVSKFLFGHGPGAAREASESAISVATLANTRYARVGIGLTGVSSLLWELGVVGLLLVFTLFATALHSARFIAQHASGHPYRQYVAEGLQVAIIVFAISLFHKNTFVFHIGYQALIYIVLGILAAWHYDELQQVDKEQEADADS